MSTFIYLSTQLVAVLRSQSGRTVSLKAASAHDAGNLER